MKARLIVFSLALSSFHLFAAPSPPDEELLPVAKGFYELYSGSQTREFPLPPFGDQDDALGYTAGESFTVPPGLKTRVEFWKKIYSEYTTTQALLHDSEHLEITYGVVDLEDIAPDSGKSYRRQKKQLNHAMSAAVDKIAGQLRELQAYADRPSDVPTELKDLYQKFEHLQSPHRFLEAADRVRAQIGQRDRIVQGFFYGGRYFQQMMDIFAQRHLPKELTRLPLVESAFNPGARSKVGASGIWQFMKSTGKLFLRINRIVDERNDPLTATIAAADLMQANYEALGSWPLAVTAYNHGRGGMLRAVRTLGSINLPEIIQNYHGPAFGFASSNFYSEFLAILEVERDYRKHFGMLMVDSPLNYESHRIGNNVRFAGLSGACGINRHELAALNPGLTDWVISGQGYIPNGFNLRVPNGFGPRCQAGERLLARVSPPRVKLARAATRVHSRRHRRRA